MPVRTYSPIYAVLTTLTNGDILVFNSTTGRWENVASSFAGTIDNIIHVMTNGDDATGTKGRMDLPFSTIQAALDAATDNDDLVLVYPGTYDEKIDVNTAVVITRNIEFMPGATLNFTGTGDLFVRTGVGSLVLNIYGYGVIKHTGVSGAVFLDVNFINIFEVDSIESTVGTLFLKGATSITLKCYKARLLKSTGGKVFDNNAPITLRNVDEVISTSGDTIDCRNAKFDLQDIGLLCSTAGKALVGGSGVLINVKIVALTDATIAGSFNDIFNGGDFMNVRIKNLLNASTGHGIEANVQVTSLSSKSDAINLSNVIIELTHADANPVQNLIGGYFIRIGGGGLVSNRDVVVAVKQKIVFTPTNVEIGDKFKITNGGDDIEFTATAATVANVTAGLTSLWNSEGGASFPLYTAVDNGTDMTVEVDLIDDFANPAAFITSTTDGGGTDDQTLGRVVTNSQGVFNIISGTILIVDSDVKIV